jgi:hypothetical protein
VHVFGSMKRNQYTRAVVPTEARQKVRVHLSLMAMAKKCRGRQSSSPSLLPSLPRSTF